MQFSFVYISVLEAWRSAIAKVLNISNILHCMCTEFDAVRLYTVAQ